jgi:hypothetical protein
MFSNQSSGERLPHLEEVVAEEEAVAEVEVEVGVVEDTRANLIRPSNQWRKPLMSEQWGKYPRTSSGIERRPMISLRKYKATYTSTPTLVASIRQRRKPPSPSHA